MSKKIWRIIALLVLLGSLTFTIGFFTGKRIGTNQAIEQFIEYQEQEKILIDGLKL